MALFEMICASNFILNLSTISLLLGIQLLHSRDAELTYNAGLILFIPTSPKSK